MASFLDLILGEVGKPYVYGGDTPAGFDCSGLGYWAAGVKGISGVPRTSQQMFEQLPAATSELQAGDFIFFNNGSGNQQPDHVAYVVDPDQHLMVSADHPGATVKVESWDGWGEVMGFRRLPGAGSDTAGTSARTVGFNPLEPSTWGLPDLNPLDNAASAVGDAVASIPAAFLSVIFGDHTIQEIAIRSLETVWGAIILATGVVMFVKVIAATGEPGRATSGAKAAAGSLAGGYVGAKRAVRTQTGRNHRSGTSARRAARTSSHERPERRSDLERSRAANTGAIGEARRRGGTTFDR